MTDAPSIDDAPDHPGIARLDEALALLHEDDRPADLIAEGRAIAALVSELGLPDNVVVAAGLCPLTDADLIDNKLYKNINLSGLPDLISSLIQLRQFALPADWQPGEALANQQSEALRKLLLATVTDVRLILVRLAEQVVKLRQAKHFDPETQRHIAIETREIYAALANRLGVWQLKWELEDLAFRYLEPEAYKDIAKKLNERRVERESFINEVISLLSEELDEAGIHAQISGRPKHIYSIFRKMRRKDRDLESLHDIRAVRLIVDSVKDCYAALGVVHNRFNYLPGEFDDYIANPKDNDYRSLHTAVVGPEGKTVEIQIRTQDMHRHAELGVAAHWRYKEGGSAPAAFEQKIGFLRQLLEPANDDSDLLEQIRDDVFEDRVYALSPKGDVVELTAGATPLDFAYHVHTQIGHRCRGAKVNGRIMPIAYKVKNGDRIEIITSGEPNPSRDWINPKLGYLASAKNRAKVRNWFRHQDREQHERQGRDILDREMVRLSVKDMPTDAIAQQLKLKDTEALSVALGAGDLTAAAVANAIQQLKGDGAEPARREIKTRRPSSTTEGISVRGVGDLMSSLAKCCQPVPPEPVVGYITLGRGVSIHRADCGNALDLGRRHPERLIEVAWGDSETATYPVELILHAVDRSGLLRDISSILADEDANVTSVNTSTDPDCRESIMDIALEIRDLPTLSSAITRLEQVPNVVSVRRKS